VTQADSSPPLVPPPVVDAGAPLLPEGGNVRALPWGSLNFGEFENNISAKPKTVARVVATKILKKE
jgi:hypothetical protein